MTQKLDHLPTDEDAEIRLSLAINARARPWIGTLMADSIDAQIMARLARTRRNNKRARAYPTEPGVMA